MSKPTTVEDVLKAFENELKWKSICEEVYEGVGFLRLDEALATIEQLVLERVVGKQEKYKGGSYSYWVGKGLLRAEQRQALRKLMGGK